MEDPELEKLAKEYIRHETKANELRPRLYAGIYAYKQAHGERRGWQTELVKATGLTRERIRQIISAEEKRRDQDRKHEADRSHAVRQVPKPPGGSVV